jgi:lysophospholipase L1-like esterase
MRKYFMIMLSCAMLFVLTGASKRPITLFMVGDSTMADKTELEASPERGWGQLFPSFLDTTKVCIQNHAKNGRSTRSFLAEGRWDEVKRRIRRGDVVIIQFGHNDTKQSDPRRYTSIEDYEANLMHMIGDAQQAKASVILCTPISRRYFKEGVFHPRHGAYPEAARRVAERMDVPLLDLEASTVEWLTKLGDEASKAFFMNVAPGECTKFPNGKTDDTHLRENGALTVGQMAAKMIVKQEIKPLCKYIRTEYTQPIYTTPCGIK